jgi:hypothetical protein
MAEATMTSGRRLVFVDSVALISAADFASSAASSSSIRRTASSSAAPCEAAASRVRCVDLLIRFQAPL